MLLRPPVLTQSNAVQPLALTIQVPPNTLTSPLQAAHAVPIFGASANDRPPIVESRVEGGTNEPPRRTRLRAGAAVAVLPQRVNWPR